MNAATRDKPMNFNISDSALLLSTYMLNVIAFFSDAHPISKGALYVVTGLTTIMAFFNQYKTFRKNFKTLWVVVTVNHVFTYLKPKKNRHRGISINQKIKDDTTNIS